MSALARMASSEHRMVQIKKGDTVILSSSPIPGNEKTVSNVVNNLLEKGADVIYSDIADIHVSGHACEEELKLVHSLIKPKYFMPVHGEYRHLRQHSMIAQDLGMNKKDIFIMENGQVLQFEKGAASLGNQVANASVLVDGLGVGDVGNIVLRDRKLLSEGGLIIVVAAISKETGAICSGPDIVSRGFVYVRESEDLIDSARETVKKKMLQCQKDGIRDWSGLKNAVREELKSFIYQKTKRSPVILPIFVEV
jgi:ribonuclease J